MSPFRYPHVKYSQDWQGNNHTDFTYQDAETGAHRCSRFTGTLSIEQAQIRVTSLRNTAASYARNEQA